MITLDDGQRQIASRAAAQIVKLVKLDTFTDHAAETIDETFWWASTPIRYKWNGTDTEQFKGVLRAMSPISRGFPHIPNAAQLSTRDGLTLDLDASKWADQFPWQRLIAKNLIGAHIEVASLLVDWGDPLPDDWKDQSGLGAVHTVRFRGEVTDVPEYNDEANTFSLVCDSIEVPLPWAVALDPLEVSEKDLGKIYPIPVGAAKRVPLVQRQVGWVTTLVSDLTAGFTGNIVVTETTGFPDSPTVFGFWIGTERLVATKINSTTINVSARGQSIGVISTIAQAHNSGAVMIEEISVANFVYSGVESLGINALYARSPQTGELIFIPPGFYGVVQADKEIDSGFPLGVVSFTPELWGKLIRLLNNESSVTVQPTVSTSGVETIQIPFGSYGLLGTVTSSIKCTITGNLLGVTDSSVVMDFLSSGSNKEAAVFWNTSGAVPQQARSVSRFRVVWKYRIESNGTHTTRLEYELSMLNHTQTSTLLATLAAGPTVSHQTTATAWFTPSPPATLADLVNSSASPPTFGNRAIIYLDQTAGGSSSSTAVAVKLESFVEVELVPLPVTVTTNVETTGAQEIGFNLDLFADVFGAVTLGAEASHDAMDDSTGWLEVAVTITDVGAPGDGLTATADGSGTFHQAAITGIIPTMNFVGRRFRFDYRLDQAAWDELILGVGAFRIFLTSTSGNDITWQFPRSCLHAVGWREFTFDPGGSSTQVVSVNGTLDFSAVSQINIMWNTTDSAAAGAISFRDLRAETRTFHTHPTDIAQWLIEENAGITNGADSGSFATAKTNLPGVTFAGDLRQAGANIGEVLARIGFESRTNFLPSEGASGTAFKAFNALATYAFPASGRTLSEFNSLRTKTKELDEQANEFVGIYDFRNQFDQTDVQGYAALIQANETTNDLSADVPTADITDAQARVGVRASDLLPFFLVPDLASIIEVFAYYAHESLRGTSLRYVLSVPYSIGYDLEPGDIIEFTPRWETSPVKCRIIRTTYPFDAPIVGLNLEEVL